MSFSSCFFKSIARQNLFGISFAVSMAVAKFCLYPLVSCSIPLILSCTDSMILGTKGWLATCNIQTPLSQGDYSAFCLRRADAKPDITYSCTETSSGLKTHLAPYSAVHGYEHHAAPYKQQGDLQHQPLMARSRCANLSQR